jgi:hypothetical protein
VAGQDTRVRRERHQHVHHRSADALEVVARAADRVLEERVAAEAELPVDDERDAVVAVAGRRQRLDAEAAGLEVAGDDLDAELVLVLDVVGMRVRAQQVGRGEALALDDLEQRPKRGTAVDEHGRPAGLVTEDVGVREPALVHRPTDDHRYTLRNFRDPG